MGFFDFWKRWKAKRIMKQLTMQSLHGLLVGPTKSKHVFDDSKTMENIGPDGVWRPPVSQASELLHLLREAKEKSKDEQDE